MFDGGNQLKINKPIRLIELFGGYGSQSLALKYLGVPFEHWRLSEWAVPSIQAYKDLHATEDDTDYSIELSKEQLLDYLDGRISMDYSKPMTREQIERKGEKWQRVVYNNMKATNNCGSIIKMSGQDLNIVDTDKYCYIASYSFPCQDLSSAGLGKGMAKGSGTRSGLLWEVERLLDECENKPQILVMENVPEVIGTNNIEHFAKWVEKLESFGYKCKWDCLNAKNYGIPQNRNRCFMVSFLGDYFYDFPKPKPLKLTLKDMLEENVDESFYLSERAIEGIKNTTFNTAKLENRTEKNGIMSTLLARDYKDPKLVVEEPLVWDGYNQQVRADSSVVGTLTRNCGADLKRNGQGIIEVMAYDEQNKYVRKDGCVGTLTTDGSSPKHNNRVIEGDLRIRRLTPRECFLLMGVKDEDINKMSKNQSNSSLYHLAGDSIVVDVLMAIFNQML
jgi:DNA (cytosine-5)-methyltransferase 1